MIRQWSVPREWPNEPAWIIGGGPSLKGFDFSRLKGRGRVFAVNTAYVVAPWADVLFWGDRRWYDWHYQKLHEHTGRYKVTTAISCYPERRDLDIKRLRKSKGRAWSVDPTALTGIDSGHAALNLAALFGCNPIYLLGFDMTTGAKGETNWHDLHKLPTNTKRYRTLFIPGLNDAAPLIAKQGIRVVNCNPQSALKCFEFKNLDELL